MKNSFYSAIRTPFLRIYACLKSVYFLLVEGVSLVYSWWESPAKAQASAPDSPTLDEAEEVHAERFNHLDGVRALLARDGVACLLVKDFNNRLPVIEAYCCGDKVLLEAMLDKLEEAALDIEGADLVKAIVNARDGYEQTLLSIVATEGGSDLINRVLSLGGEDGLNIRRQGALPLQQAIARGHPKTAQSMIEWIVANVEQRRAQEILNQQDSYEQTALYLAITENQVETVKTLLAAGVTESFLKKTRGYLPLLQATTHEEPAVLEVLLSWVFDNLPEEQVQQILNAQDGFEQTLLWKTVFIKWPYVTKKILDSGAGSSLLLKTEGCLPLVQACAMPGQTETVRAILHWANEALPMNMKQYYINASDGRGQTALFAALTRNQPLTVQSLLESGAKQSLYLGFNKCLPLTQAVACDYTQVVDCIIHYCKSHMSEEEVGEFVCLQDGHDQTPLLLAVKGGREAMVRLFLGLGDKETLFQQISRFSLLVQAAILPKSCKTDIVNILIEWARNNIEENRFHKLINSQDSHEQTVLYSALYPDRSDIIQTLLESGARESLVKRTNERLPLQQAVLGNRSQSVNVMLAWGRENMDSQSFRDFINMQDGAGNTALSIAADQSSVDFVEKLLQYGAKESLFCRELSPLSLALMKNHITAVQAIIRWASLNLNEIEYYELLHKREAGQQSAYMIAEQQSSEYLLQRQTGGVLGDIGILADSQSPQLVFDINNNGQFGLRP